MVIQEKKSQDLISRYMLHSYYFPFLCIMGLAQRDRYMQYFENISHSIFMSKQMECAESSMLSLYGIHSNDAVEPWGHIFTTQSIKKDIVGGDTVESATLVIQMPPWNWARAQSAQPVDMISLLGASQNDQLACSSEYEAKGITRLNKVENCKQVRMKVSPRTWQSASKGITL